MPLHLLQQQLGHADVQQTMKYARFHPSYSDVAGYFREVGEQLGISGPDLGPGGRSVERDADRTVA